MNVNRPVIIFSILSIITLSIVGWYFSRPQGSLEFALAPQSVDLTLEGEQQTIEHNQILKIPPATYTLKIEAEGFETFTKTVVVEDDKTNRVVIAMTPLTDAARKQLKDSTVSQKVIKEYEEVKYQELQSSLPLSGVDYAVISCPSIKQPESDSKAICINSDTKAGELNARKKIQDFGFNPDSLEILTGTENIRIIMTKPTFKVEYYANTKPEVGTGKTALFITPINAQAVPYTTTFSPELETIKKTALAELESNGYNPKKYDIFYNDFYLSKYNPGNDAPAEHAMPPSYN